MPRRISGLRPPLLAQEGWLGNRSRQWGIEEVARGEWRVASEERQLPSRRGARRVRRETKAAGGGGRPPGFSGLCWRGAFFFRDSFRYGLCLPALRVAG